MKRAETKARAFAMFCLNIPIQDIAKVVGVRSRKTIYRWIKEDFWEKRKHEIVKLAREKETNDTNLLHIGIAKSVLKVYAEAIREGSKERNAMLRRTTHRDAIEAVKLHRLVMGESTENTKLSGGLTMQQAVDLIKREDKKKEERKNEKI